MDIHERNFTMHVTYAVKVPWSLLTITVKSCRRLLITLLLTLGKLERIKTVDVEKRTMVSQRQLK